MNKKYNKNPFLPIENLPATSRSKVGVKRSEVLVDTDTGTATGFVEVSKFHLFDAEPFIKMYNLGVPVWCGLSRSASLLLGLLLLRLDYGKDSVLFDLKTESELIGLNDFVVRRAINELIERRIIARSNLSVKYFINTNYFFRGDRLKYLKKNGIKRSPETGGVVSSESGINSLENSVQGGLQTSGCIREDDSNGIDSPEAVQKPK